MPAVEPKQLQKSNAKHLQKSPTRAQSYIAGGRTFIFRATDLLKLPGCRETQRAFSGSECKARQPVSLWNITQSTPTSCKDMQGRTVA